MYLNNKLVFLAGSTGLVGSSIMNHVLSCCPETTIRASYRHTRPFIDHERIEYVQGDLRSQSDCRRMVRGCDYAIMAAASTAGSRVSVSEPWKQVNDNLIMNAQMLEAFHFEKIRRVVYIGSATAYQEFQGHIKEDDLDLNKDPHPAYLGIGWVFRYVEKLCKFWHEQSGLEVVIVRASNIFGPYAKFDPATSNFIPAIIRKAADRMDPFEVWGSPEVTRDVIYSEDFASAIVGLLAHHQVTMDTFNVGSEAQTTVDDVVRWALKYAGHSPGEISYSSDKPTTISFRALDCSKIRGTLNWRPKLTIEEGVKRTAEWWIENKDSWTK